MVPRRRGLIRTDSIRAVIVVPIYKETLNAFEEISLKRCLEVFRDREICYVAPWGLRIPALPTGQNLEVERFDASYFGSQQDYNRLMVAVDFYRRFENYEFMLIYQLDAYVFRDELDFWCKRGWDYIGAPWFEGDRMEPMAGNGGFSLRRIPAFISILGLGHRRLKSFGEVAQENKRISPASRRAYTVSRNYLSRANRVRAYLTNPGFNEDRFYSYTAPRLDSNFKVADSRTGIPFSFEVRPRDLYAMNDDSLPFGCHAYEKYDPDFWELHIPGLAILHKQLSRAAISEDMQFIDKGMT